MKKSISFGITLLALLLTACGGKGSQQPASSSTTPDSSSEPASSVNSSKESSKSKAPVKSISVSSISLGNEGEKAYITVRGTQTNYTADDFKWAWGLKDQETNKFADGKEKPEASDFKVATFNESNEFTVKYCLTDIQGISAGKLYRIYGGTPESYDDIPFASNMFGANDATRKYYLRQDENNSLTFENIQPLTYDKALIVEVSESDLPNGVTQAGAYLKFGGKNTKNITMETINSWNEANNIAGDFQRCIPSWQSHPHVNEERFWKIEDNYVYFYLYCGFIEPEEGWMVHFDVVSGNQNAGLTTSNKINGETTYTVNGAQYKVYSGQGGDEEHYWDCVGVYRVA